MRTATRGTALVLLGAVLVQFPAAGIAAGYEPHEPASTGQVAGGGTGQPEELPVARSWQDVIRQVRETSPDPGTLRMSTAEQAPELMRCFRLEEEKYCLGLGFVEQTPSKAELSRAVAAEEPSGHAASGSGAASPVEDGGEGSAPGALSPGGFVTARAALPREARVDAELDELRTAWEGREKARELRLFDAEEPGTEGDKPGRSTPRPVHPPAPVPSTPPSTTPGTPQPPDPWPTPTPEEPTTPPPPDSPRAYPPKVMIMGKFRTSQERGYWCGPATFQAIDWADDNQRDSQGSWAKDLGTTRSGTAISAMVKQTNLKTGWDNAAGTYIVQSVGHWNTKKFFAIHEKHLGDGSPAPIIEHTQLLKRYFPYLAFNHSGHFQVGRGYDRTKNTIAIFEVFNERRFNSRGNVTDGPKNIPASALFNATLANKFKNIGL